jgi:hypothetical protein
MNSLNCLLKITHYKKIKISIYLNKKISSAKIKLNNPKLKSKIKKMIKILIIVALIWNIKVEENLKMTQLQNWVLSNHKEN